MGEPMAYSDALLDSLRGQADPLADDTIAALGRTTSPGHVGALIPRLVAVPAPDPGDLPECVEAWLQAHAKLPAWADRERLNRASALWVKRGVTMAMILGTASLAECYAASRGIKAITFSNRLGTDTLRRLRETVLWVNLIMLPGGLTEGDEGIRAVYKVRLMHAAIRYLIGQTGRWDAQNLGLPLCQEDMAGTLMTFAYTVPRSLGRLGVSFTETEAADYIYFWSVVGAMLGVAPELIPHDMAGAQALTAQIFRRQHAATPEGRAMTEAMLRTYSGLLPGRVLAGFFPAFIRYLSGDEIADLLGVPASRRTNAMRYYRLLGSVADLTWRCTYRFSFGSSASRRPSPTQLNESTVKKIKSPGAREIQGAVRR
ncbi:MAG: hypothetical protein K0R39_4433 [Symbiobacteriaceae bacterium]|jgi:hypothetical protein|nr:hypothetical protein [Symbiobacteriaceae bacterium]